MRKEAKILTASILSLVAAYSINAGKVQSEQVFNIQVSNHKPTPISLGENIDIIVQSNRTNPWTSFEFNNQGIYQQGHSDTCSGNTDTDFYLKLGENEISVRQGDASEKAIVNIEK